MFVLIKKVALMLTLLVLSVLVLKFGVLGAFGVAVASVVIGSLLVLFLRVIEKHFELKNESFYNHAMIE